MSERDVVIAITLSVRPCGCH